MAFSKLETMGSVIQDIQPDIIINAAAYTIVDGESVTRPHYLYQI